MLIAPFLRKFGGYTVPEFIGGRYGCQMARVVAILCVILVSFTLLAGQTRGIGIVFARLLDLNVATGTALGLGIVTLFAVVGGMKGVTYSQVAQYLVLIFAGTVPAVFITLQLTGNPWPQVALGSHLVAGSDLYLLDKLDKVVTDLGLAAYTSPVGGIAMLDMVCIAAALMVGTAGMPHVVVRFFTVRRVRDARSSAVWAMIFIGILYTTVPAVAAISRLHLGGVADGVELVNPLLTGLPGWVVALAAAGAVAAALTTAAGLLLVIAAAISHDLVKGMIAKGVREAGEVLMGRISIVVAAALALLIALSLGDKPPGALLQLVVFAFGLAAASLFPALVLGVFDRRMNRWGATLGMLAGLGLTLAYILHFGGSILGMPEASALERFLGISPAGIGALGMVLNFAVAWVVSRITPPPPERIRAVVEDIRVPRGAGEAIEH
jgi:cation/acetate symporter